RKPRALPRVTPARKQRPGPARITGASMSGISPGNSLPTTVQRIAIIPEARPPLPYSFSVEASGYDIRQPVERADRPDAPTPHYCLLTGFRVRWINETELQPQLWRVLQYLLSRDDYPFPIDCLEEAWPTGHAVSSKRLANVLSDLNKQLLSIQF